ncbi:MAG: hypothetical protein LC725_02150, partial [Lentisphaerae bacterium]|nr:hypothetical protein [Lentisphaerota bacterium]
LSIDTGVVDTNWTPMPDGTVYGFQFQAPYTFMYGNFAKVAGVHRLGFAVLTHGLPQVAITEPAPGEDHWEQSVATLVFEAQAQADTGLSVTQVVYSANGVTLGAATVEPYTMVWTPVPEGQYTVTAVAYDQSGLSGAPSAPVNISVTPLAAAGDFDGDGKADPALLVINPDTGASEWYVWCSGAGYARVGPRLPGEDLSVPLAGDIDGDGKADPVLWWTEPDGGAWKNVWYLWRSSMGYAPMGPVILGAAGLYPLMADFDGDGKADPGIYKTDGVYNIWRAWQSGAGYADTGDVRLGAWIDGMALAADFDGDGRADPAIFTENNWYVWLSGSGYEMIGPRHLPAPDGGLPLAADFDGDGFADPAIYVPAGSGYSSGWYAWLSSAGYARRGPFNYTAP